MIDLYNFESASTKCSRVIALIGLLGMLALAFATVVDALLRWIFSSPITGVRDAGSLFTAVIISSCFALCIAEQKNITIRFFGSLFGYKGEHLFEAFGNLLTLIVFAVVSYGLWGYAGELAIDKETTMVLSWPLSPWWRLVSVLVGVCVPVQAVVFFRNLTSAIIGKNFNPAIKKVE